MDKRKLQNIEKYLDSLVTENWLERFRSTAVKQLREAGIKIPRKKPAWKETYDQVNESGDIFVKGWWEFLFRVEHVQTDFKEFTSSGTGEAAKNAIANLLWLVETSSRLSVRLSNREQKRRQGVASGKAREKTASERQELVKQLHQDGKTVKQICIELEEKENVRVSLQTIYTDHKALNLEKN